MSDNHTIEPDLRVSTKAITVELRGIDYVPEGERTSKPSNLFWVFVGAQLTFGIMILGWLPVVFGLDFWSAVIAMTLGVLFGTFMFGFFSLFGPRTGTNSAVSTGAFYGVNGRLMGSLKAIFIAVGYLALTVWVSGDMVAAGLASMWGGETTGLLRAVSYLVISLLVIVIALYGHDLLVKVQSIIIPIVLVGFAIMVLTTIGDFVPAISAFESQLGTTDYWVAWIASFVIAMQLPISYMPYANGYTRYISRKKHSDRATYFGISLGMVVGLLIVLNLGAYVSFLFAADEAIFGDGIISAVPLWFVIPLAIVSLIGALDQCGFALYGGGLDTSSVIPKLKRVPATLVLSAISVLLVFLGSFVWDAVVAVTGFVTIIAVLVLPWATIAFTSFLFQRRRIWPLDLQVYEKHIRGGAYWYRNGWNWRSTTAYLVGVFVALMFVQSDIWVGPLAFVFGGADLSMFVSAVLGLVLYLIFRAASPERLVIPATDDDALASPLLKEAMSQRGEDA